MSDKFLTEREWKAFSKNASYKDGALLKALAGLEKAEKDGPGERLKALDELDKQADALLKANKGDKALADYLSDLDKAAAKTRKLAERDRQALDNEDGEDDEPASVWLDPKKLLAQLTLCRRDPERRVQFAYVDGKGEQPAVLAMSPKVSGRKLFAKLQAETGAKSGAYGSAWVDDTSLMLQLDKPLGGLVKKIRGPVKDCGFRVAKAVLWNADGTVFEQDEAPDEGLSGDAQTPEPTTPVEAALTPADAGPKFNARLSALLPRLAAADPARLAELKGKVANAGTLARNKEFEQAHALLDEVEALLAAAAGTSPPTPLAPGAPPPDPKAGAEFNARLAALLLEVKEAIARKGGQAAELKALVTEAGMLAREKAFDRAHAMLDALDAKLAALQPDSVAAKFSVQGLDGEAIAPANEAARKLQRAHVQMCRTWAVAAAAIAEFRASLASLPPTDHPSYEVLAALSKVPAPWYVEERYEAALGAAGQVLATLLDDAAAMDEAGKRVAWVADIFTNDAALVELARGLRTAGLVPTLPEPAEFFEPLLTAAV